MTNRDNELDPYLKYIVEYWKRENTRLHQENRDLKERLEKVLSTIKAFYNVFKAVLHAEEENERFFDEFIRRELFRS